MREFPSEMILLIVERFLFEILRSPSPHPLPTDAFSHSIVSCESQQLEAKWIHFAVWLHSPMQFREEVESPSCLHQPRPQTATTFPHKATPLGANSGTCSCSVPLPLPAAVIQPWLKFAIATRHARPTGSILKTVCLWGSVRWRVVRPGDFVS